MDLLTPRIEPPLKKEKRDESEPALEPVVSSRTPVFALPDYNFTYSKPIVRGPVAYISVLAIDLFTCAALFWIQFGLTLLITDANLFWLFESSGKLPWMTGLALYTVALYGLVCYKLTKITLGEWVCRTTLWSASRK
jgi:hypothetical protein